MLHKNHEYEKGFIDILVMRCSNNSMDYTSINNCAIYSKPRRNNVNSTLNEMNIIRFRSVTHLN